MGSEDERELDDRWWLGWRGLRIERVESLARGSAIFIGARSRLDVDLPDPMPVAGDEVLSAVAFKSGALRLVLASGTHIGVAPSVTWKALGEPGRTWAARADGLTVTNPLGWLTAAAIRSRRDPCGHADERAAAIGGSLGRSMS